MRWRFALVALGLLLPGIASSAHAEPQLRALNDAELVALAAAEGWPGAGTPSDPILIEDHVGPLWFQDITLSLRVVRQSATLTSRFDAGLLALDVADLVVESPQIRGGGWGIFVEDAGRFELHGGEVTNATQVAVSVAGGPAHPTASLSIEGTRIADSRVGIDLDHAGPGVLTVRHVTLLRDDIGIRAEPFSRAAQVILVDNIVTKSRDWAITAMADDVVIERNVISDSTGGIQVRNRDRPQVRDNVIEATTFAIFATVTTGAIVEQNTVTDSGTAILMMASNGATLTRNILTGDRVGLSVSNGFGILAYDNLVVCSQSNAEALNANVQWTVTPRPGTNIVGGDTIAGNAWGDNLWFDRDANGVSDTIYLPLRPQPRTLGFTAGAPPTFDWAPLAYPPRGNN